MRLIFFYICENNRHQMKKNILLIAILISTIAVAQKKEKVKGSKLVTTEKFEVTAFDQIEIEDNLEVRENTTEILELANYKVLTAENGKIGVEMAKNSSPDLIICDIMMPELDGYGVLHMVRKKKSIQLLDLRATLQKHRQLQNVKLLNSLASKPMRPSTESPASVRSFFRILSAAEVSAEASLHSSISCGDSPCFWRSGGTNTFTPASTGDVTAAALKYPASADRFSGSAPTFAFIRSAMGTS